jgi:RNA polymerase sigma factor (sigma-70 family)
VPFDIALLRSLVERIRQGDADAEEEVVRQFARRIFVMSFVRTRDREIARELVQDILMAVIAALRKGQLLDPDKLPAFVHGTARNLVNNRLRSERRPPPLEALSDDLPEPSKIETIEDAERLQFVHQALESLADEDRKILHLTLVEGYKPAEIAGLLGLTAEVVRTRKLRATRKVAEFVQGRLSRSRATSHMDRKETE